MKILQGRLVRVAAALGEILLLGYLNTGGHSTRRGVILQKLKSFTFVFVFGIAAFGLAPSPAGAAVVYDYIGNNFTTIGDSTTPTGTYDTTMRVTGSFSVAAPLSLPSLTEISASLLSYSFFDGRQTLDSGNSQLFTFQVGTDGAGSPTTWDIRIREPFPAPTSPGDLARDIITINTTVETDQANIFECLTIIPDGPPCATGTADFAIVPNSAGTWSAYSTHCRPLTTGSYPTWVRFVDPFRLWAVRALSPSAGIAGPTEHPHRLSPTCSTA